MDNMTDKQYRSALEAIFEMVKGCKNKKEIVQKFEKIIKNLYKS